MNTTLTQSTNLKKLLDTDKTQRQLSIYLPTHPSSRSETINEDSARFKSLLKTIKNNPDLHRHDPQVLATLKQLEKLITNRTFWSKQSAALAVFANEDKQHIFHLPYEVTEQSFVSNKFIISPLLAMQTAMAKFYLIEVNTKQPKLFHATPSQLKTIDDADLPGSLEDALQLDEFQQMQQFHTGEGHGGAMFHGHGGADDHKDKDIQTYLRLLAKKIDAYLKNSKTPLIVVGTKTRTSSLKKQLKYKFVADDEITGSYDSPQNEQLLLKHVTKIVDSHLDADLKKLESSFKSAYGNELAVASKAAVDQAAEMDNVESLLLPLLRKTNDSIREESSEHYIFDLPNDLANIEDTVRACHAVKAAILPTLHKKTTSSDDVAAICRYKVTLS